MSEKRMRLREAGIIIGKLPTGKHNAITDVPGVFVGHSTIIKGRGKLRAGHGPVRTGVTAILPNAGDIFNNRVIGSAFILNGAGEVSGLTQLMEWGLIETPILLTNTLSVGTCNDSLIKYMVKKYPGIGTEYDVVIPIVGECDDSWLNDIGGRHVKNKHVLEAINKASKGPVMEGNVGGGTGMITCDFSGGIGTSSRKICIENEYYTVGVLVMSNFGKMEDFRIDGIPVGRSLRKEFHGITKRLNNYGSIIAVIGTNVPLSPHQIMRLCKRGALGIGRVGSYAANDSGEILMGFSTSNAVPRVAKKMLYKVQLLLDQAINPVYQAVIEAMEEAILNALFMADGIEGHSGHFAPALPIQQTIEFLNNYRYSAKIT